MVVQHRDIPGQELLLSSLDFAYQILLGAIMIPVQLLESGNYVLFLLVAGCVFLLIA